MGHKFAFVHNVTAQRGINRCCSWSGQMMEIGLLKSLYPNICMSGAICASFPIDDLAARQTDVPDWKSHFQTAISKHDHVKAKR